MPQPFPIPLTGLRQTCSPPRQRGGISQKLPNHPWGQQSQGTRPRVGCPTASCTRTLRWKRKRGVCRPPSPALRAPQRQLIASLIKPGQKRSLWSLRCAFLRFILAVITLLRSVSTATIFSAAPRRGRQARLAPQQNPSRKKTCTEMRRGAGSDPRLGKKNWEEKEWEGQEWPRVPRGGKERPRRLPLPLSRAPAGAGSSSHEPKATLKGDKRLGFSQGSASDAMRDAATRASVAAQGCEGKSGRRGCLPRHLRPGHQGSCSLASQAGFEVFGAREKEKQPRGWSARWV